MTQSYSPNPTKDNAETKAQVTSSFAKLWVAIFPDYMYNQDNLIIEGSEVKQRRWVDPDSELYITYHDNEWGRPEHDDHKLFEMLTLEGFQAGLFWLTILKRHEVFRRTFDNFQPDVIIQYDPEKVETLMADASIVCNRRRIEAAVRNARVYLSIQKEVGSSSRYLWSFADEKAILNTDDEVHAHTRLSDCISKDLKHRDMSFVGTTIIYTFLQAMGVVNDHGLSCFYHPNNQ